MILLVIAAISPVGGKSIKLPAGVLEFITRKIMHKHRATEGRLSHTAWSPAAPAQAKRISVTTFLLTPGGTTEEHEGTPICALLE